jgi:hypothetical protein
LLYQLTHGEKPKWSARIFNRIRYGLLLICTSYAPNLLQQQETCSTVLGLRITLFQKNKAPSTISIAASGRVVIQTVQPGYTGFGYTELHFFLYTGKLSKSELG